MARPLPKMIGLTLLLAAFLCLILVAVLRWTPLAVWLTNRAVDRFLEPALEMEIEIQDVGGNLINQFTLEGVLVRSPEGAPIVEISLLSLEYDWRDLIDRRWRLSRFLVQEPVLHLRSGGRPEAAGGPQTALSRQMDARPAPPDRPDREDQEGTSAARQRPQSVLPIGQVPDLKIERIKIIGGRVVDQAGTMVDSLILALSLEVEDERARLEIFRSSVTLPRRNLSLHSSASGLVLSPRDIRLERLQARTPASGMSLSGRLVLAPSPSCSLEVRSDSLSLDEAGPILSQGGMPSVRLRAAGEVRWDGDVWSVKLEAQGQVDRYRIDQIRSVFTWNQNRLAVGELALNSPGVDLRGRGELLLEGPQPVFEADLILREVDLQAVAPQAPSTRLNGRLLAEGTGLDPRSMVLNAHLDLDSTAAQGYQFESIAGQFQFRQGTLSTARGLEIEGQGVRLLVAGSIDDQGHLDASAQAAIEDAGRLFPERELGGTLEARIQAKGPLDDPRVAGRVEGTDLRYGERRLDRVRGSFGLSGAVSRRDGFFALRFSDAHLSQINLRQGHLQGRLEDRSLLVDSLLVESPQGRVSLAGRLDMAGDRLRLEADRLSGRIMEIDVRTVEPLEAVYQEEQLHLRDVQLSVGEGILTAEAVIGPGFRMSGRLRVERFQMEMLSGLLGEHRDLSGLLDLDVTASGSLDQPRVDAALAWNDGRFDRLDFERFETRLEAVGDSLAVETMEIRRKETVLRGGGHLFVDLSGGRLLSDRDWDLEITGEGDDLNVLSLIIEDIQQVEGPFTLQLRAEGTPGEPTYQGSFRLQDGSIRLIPLGNEIQNVVLSAHLDGQYVVIDEISAVTPIEERNLLRRVINKLFGTQGRGYLEARGRINLAGPAFDLSVSGKRFYLEYLPQEVEAETDLDLRITGRQRPTIAGRIDLRRALISRSMQAAQAGGTDGGPPPFDLDLTVEIPKNCWLRNESADIEIRGQLRVMQEVGTLSLLGTLNTIQGNYYFYGRSFQIDRGEVTFDRPEEINPQLDIAAWTQVDGERIDLIVSGRLESPNVTMTSSSGYSEGDIISLLTLQQTGTELDTLAAQEVVARQAESFFGGYLQRAINRKTGRFLGVETFRIQPDPEDRLNISQAELTVGTYLSSQFYVEYSRRLSQESGEQVGIEYNLSRNFSLQGRRDKDGLYRIGVTARWQY
jgi:autotransporter translocation and assembly factor TamB